MCDRVLKLLRKLVHRAVLGQDALDGVLLVRVGCINGRVVVDDRVDVDVVRRVCVQEALDEVRVARRFVEQVQGADVGVLELVQNVVKDRGRRVQNELVNRLGVDLADVYISQRLRAVYHQVEVAAHRQADDVEVGQLRDVRHRHLTLLEHKIGNGLVHGLHRIAEGHAVRHRGAECDARILRDRRLEVAKEAAHDGAHESADARPARHLVVLKVGHA